MECYNHGTLFNGRDDCHELADDFASALGKSDYNVVFNYNALEYQLIEEI